MAIQNELQDIHVLTRDELVEFGNLGRDREIDGLVTKFNSQSTKNGGLDLVGDNQLLAFGNGALAKSISNLVKGGLVEFLHNIQRFRNVNPLYPLSKHKTLTNLGGCNNNVELVSVGTHKLVVGSNDLLGLNKTTVLSESLEKVGGDLGVLSRLHKLLHTSLLG